MAAGLSHREHDPDTGGRAAHPLHDQRERREHPEHDVPRCRNERRSCSAGESEAALHPRTEAAVGGFGILRVTCDPSGLGQA